MAIKNIRISQTHDQLRHKLQAISSEIQKGFSGRESLSVTLQFPNGENELNPVFCRNVSIAKGSLKPLGRETDIPDMSDVLETALPWVGLCTFSMASRPFRNKNQFMASVDVVIELDAQLFTLKDYLTQRVLMPTEVTPPSIYTRRHVEHRMTKEHGIEIIHLSDMAEVEAKALCMTDDEINPKLFAFMGRYGYTHQKTDNGIMIFTSEDGESSKIAAYRHGAIINM